MKLHLEKTPFGLAGMTPGDQTAIDDLKKGTYAAELKQPRNIKFHRKFFSLAHVAHDMQDQYKTFDSFLDAIKIAAGEFDVVQVKIPDFEKEMNAWGGITIHHLHDRKEGTNFVVLKPKSISFSKMDETIFESFYSRVIDALITNFCPGSTPNEMDEAARKYLNYA